MQERPLMEWRNALLGRYSLDHPDGRELYRYRATDQEFDALKQALRSVLGAQAPSALAAQGLHFSGAFLFNAAEWWRREYDAQWEWQPILMSLTGAPWTWSVPQRNDCVERGFRYWALRRNSADGLSYLGPVAVQGGLPLRVLADASGRLGNVLRRALMLARGGAAQAHTIHGWIESLAGQLPKSYRRAEVYDLLTQVVVTTLDFVSNASIEQPDRAIEHLDQAISGSRDRYPLPVDDAAARHRGLALWHVASRRA